jgi:hypothetical protein
MFRLSPKEADLMRSQIVTASKRNIRYQPYAFTEHGVAMLSSVLNSDRAVQMNILIIRAFVKLREVLATHKDLAARIQRIEVTQGRQASVINILAHEIKQLKRLPPAPPKRRIGFKKYPRSELH